MIDLNRIQSITSDIDDMKNKYNIDITILSTHQKQKTEVEKRMEKLNTEKEEVITKKTILEEASTEARENAKELLKDVATNAVQMVFGDNNFIDIEMREKGIKADVILRTVYPDHVVETDPAEEDGGGSADVVALSKFCSISELAGKDNKAPWFLDEPTKYVHGNSGEVATFIKEMVEYTERQTFLVTEDEYVSSVGDVAYKMFKSEDGTSVATKIQ
jgi:Uncharacterized protein conserved in bacteria with the myosin-like domain